MSGKRRQAKLPERFSTWMLVLTLAVGSDLSKL